MEDFDTQRVARVIEAQLSQIFSANRGKPMTEPRLAQMREQAVEFLRSLHKGGDIPDDVNVEATQAVARDVNPSAVDVQLPVLLRLYMEDGFKSVRTPRFRHGSECCRFLGHGLGHDLYYCHQYSMPTVIARHSSAPADYVSGIALAAASPWGTAPALALALAREAGFWIGGGAVEPGDGF